MKKTQKISKKSKKNNRPKLSIFESPFLLGVIGFGPFLVVFVLTIALFYSFLSDNPQGDLIEISFDDRDRVSIIATTMLEQGDPVLAQTIYSKMIDGMNLNSGRMSIDWVDNMILDLNPKSGLSEDIKTKTMMSESIKSKALYLRLAKMFAKLGFLDKAREAENKALEIDPQD